MANENNYIPEGSGPEGQVQPGDDLKSEAKDTLGSYLSSTTMDSSSRNEFPIEDLPRVEVNLQQGDGLPAEFQTGGESANPGYTRTFPTESNSSNQAVSEFETLSNSGMIETLGDILNKNAQTAGHNLLRDIVSNRAANEPGMGDATGQSAIESPAGATE